MKNNKISNYIAETLKYVYICQSPFFQFLLLPVLLKDKTNYCFFILNQYFSQALVLVLSQF